MRKGHTNNPHGRPPGKPNKVTGEVREWISQIIDKNRHQFERDLKKLEPKERVVIFEKLLQFVIPKIKEEHVTMEDAVKILEERRRQFTKDILLQIQKKPHNHGFGQIQKSPIKDGTMQNDSPN